MLLGEKIALQQSEDCFHFERLPSERVGAVFERERHARSAQLGVINSHDHLKRLHRVLAAAHWLAVFRDGVEPVLDEPPIRRAEAAFGGGHAGRVALETLP